MRILLLLGVITWHVTSSNAAISTSNDERYITRFHNFSDHFFKAAAEHESGNFVCSPINAAMVLSIAAFGAEGETKKQFKRTVGFSRTTSTNEIGIRSLVKRLDDFRDAELHYANNIFLARQLGPKRKFLDVINSAFRSKARAVDFRNSAEPSSTINDWCKVKTNDHIEDVTSANDFDSNTKLVLVSAVYFKGNWSSQFDPTRTKLRPFYVNGKTKNVATMSRYGSYRVGEVPGFEAKFIEVLYSTSSAKRRGRRGAIIMYIILSDDIEGFVELIQNLDKITINKRMGEHRNCRLFLPRFKIENTINLEEPLRKLGLGHIFTNKANFTKIAENSRLRVNNVIQKVKIEVDEGGNAAPDSDEWDTSSRDTTRSDGWDTASRHIARSDEWDTASRHTTRGYVFDVNRPFISLIVTESGLHLASAIITDPGSN